VLPAARRTQGPVCDCVVGLILSPANSATSADANRAIVLSDAKVARAVRAAEPRAVRQREEDRLPYLEKALFTSGVEHNPNA
jgi:hypothetical protein